MPIRNIDIERYSTPLHEAGMRRQGDMALLFLSGKPEGVDFRAGQPYRTKEGRIMVITSGWWGAEIDLQQQRVEAGGIVLIVPGALTTIYGCSADFCASVLAFTSLPDGCANAQSFALQANEEIFQRLLKYYDLLQCYFQMQQFPHDIVDGLFRSLILEFMHQHQTIEQQQSATPTFRFIKLLNQEGHVKHPIAWYADRLCISPNHLSTCVKRDSGATVLEWIDRALLQEAKVQLRHSTLPISDISYALGFANASFFAQFFKRETGQLPKDYRMNR